MSLGGNRYLVLRRPLLSLVVAALAATSLALVPSVAAAGEGGSVVLPPAGYTASACAGKSPIVVASDAAAQSDLYSAVTLAGVVGTDCIVLAGGRGESWLPDQRARLDAADADGYVVGGIAAVPNAKVAGLSLARVAGADRWETARLVGAEARSRAGVDDVDAAASVGAEDPTTDCADDSPIVVASDVAAQSDLYSAVTLAGVIGTDCIVLAGDRDDAMPAAQQARLNTGAEGGYVVGGLAAVSNAKIAGRDMIRLAGTDRWETAQFVGRLAGGDTTVGTSTEDEAEASPRPGAEPGGFTAVSAGFSHSCGLRTDGSVTCWGSDSYHQASAASVSVKVTKRDQPWQPAGDWCGVYGLVESRQICWQSNVNGQPLPPAGSTSTLCGPEPGGDEDVCWGLDPSLAYTAVSAGRAYSCGVRIDGSVTCWGLDQFGRADAPSGSFSAVSAGHAHTCGIRSNGTVECWGRNDSGQSEPPSGTFAAVTVGWAHSCGLRTNGTVKCWGDNNSVQSAAPTGSFASISGGFDHTCGLRTDGVVRCWGSDRWGQSSPPSGVFAALSAGSSDLHSCGLRVNGAIECWGNNQYGQGDPPPGNFLSVSVGGHHTCGLRTNGTVECWGDNEHGQTSVSRGAYATVSVEGGHACGLRTDGSIACWGSRLRSPSREFVAVSAGGSVFVSPFACGLRTDHAVECWGERHRGPHEGVPSAVPSGRFSAVAAGLNHVCALRTDGTIVCWGDNEHGQSSAPRGTFSAISVSRDNSCALRTDNTAVCWGVFEPNRPAFAPGGDFSAVAAGYHHACGIRRDATVNCWGLGGGRGDPPGKFAVISAGQHNNCGLRDDGSVYCWGSEFYDGLLDDYPFELVAVSIGGVGGDYGTWCGILTDGSVRCSGGLAENRIALPS